MLPTQGPGVPVTRYAFSSRVSWFTKSLACWKASSHPIPVAFADETVCQFTVVLRSAGVAGQHTGWVDRRACRKVLMIPRRPSSIRSRAYSTVILRMRGP